MWIIATNVYGRTISQIRRDANNRIHWLHTKYSRLFTHSWRDWCRCPCRVFPYCLKCLSSFTKQSYVWYVLLQILWTSSCLFYDKLRQQVFRCFVVRSNTILCHIATSNKNSFAPHHPVCAAIQYKRRHCSRKLVEQCGHHCRHYSCSLHNTRSCRRECRPHVPLPSLARQPYVCPFIEGNVHAIMRCITGLWAASQKFGRKWWKIIYLCFKGWKEMRTIKKQKSESSPSPTNL